MSIWDEIWGGNGLRNFLGKQIRACKITLPPQIRQKLINAFSSGEGVSQRLTDEENSIFTAISLQRRKIFLLIHHRNPSDFLWSPFPAGECLPLRRDYVTTKVSFGPSAWRWFSINKNKNLPQRWEIYANSLHKCQETPHNKTSVADKLPLMFLFLISPQHVFSVCRKLFP